jgi:hypothetical protein
METLYRGGYIDGVTLIPVLGERTRWVKIGDIRITPKGLEHLKENSLMRKAANAAGGIADLIP